MPRVRSGVYFGAAEVDGNNRLISHYPRIMTRRNIVEIARTDFYLGSVIQPYMQPA